MENNGKNKKYMYTKSQIHKTMITYVKERNFTDDARNSIKKSFIRRAKLKKLTRSYSATTYIFPAAPINDSLYIIQHRRTHTYARNLQTLLTGHSTQVYDAFVVQLHLILISSLLTCEFVTL